MNCSDYAEWISAELDGELEPENIALLDEHAAACETCRKIREDYRVNRLLLHTVTPLKAPRDSFRNILAQLETSSGEVLPAELPAPQSNVVSLTDRNELKGRRGRKSRPTWMVALQAAACFTVLFLSGLFYLGWTDPQWNAGPAAAPSPSQLVSARSLLRGHALLQAANPIDDQSAWQYVASESDLNMAPNAPENQTHKGDQTMVQEDLR
jgi:anti-sigma factor RsiW